MSSQACRRLEALFFRISTFPASTSLRSLHHLYPQHTVETSSTAQCSRARRRSVIAPLYDTSSANCTAPAHRQSLSQRSHSYRREQPFVGNKPAREAPKGTSASKNAFRTSRPDAPRPNSSGWTGLLDRPQAHHTLDRRSLDPSPCWWSRSGDLQSPVVCVPWCFSISSHCLEMPSSTRR